MTSQASKKHFVNRINNLKSQKINEINAAYPTTALNVVDAILKGSAPLKKKADIIAVINERMDKGRYYGDLGLTDIFDISELEKKNKTVGDTNKKTQELLKSKLDKEVTHILDMLHFGENAELLNILNKFEKEDFTVLN